MLWYKLLKSIINMAIEWRVKDEKQSQAESAGRIWPVPILWSNLHGSPHDQRRGRIQWLSEGMAAQGSFSELVIAWGHRHHCLRLRKPHGGCFQFQKKRQLIVDSLCSHGRSLLHQHGCTVYDLQRVVSAVGNVSHPQYISGSHLRICTHRLQKNLVHR